MQAGPGMIIQCVHRLAPEGGDLFSSILQKKIVENKNYTQKFTCISILYSRTSRPEVSVIVY